MADSTPKSYHTDPTLWLYTSLTSGSSHIVTATSRLETILKANKIPFRALDVATDEKARMLWGRRAGKRKLPGLVRMGMVVGGLDEIEEWNEFGELKEHVGELPASTSTSTPALSAADTPSKPSGTQLHDSKKPEARETPNPLSSASTMESSLTTAMRQVGLEAAKKAGEIKSGSKLAGKKPEISRTAEVSSEPDDSMASQKFPSPTTTKAGVSRAPGSGSGSKSDSLPLKTDDASESTTTLVEGTAEIPRNVVTTQRGSSISLASAEEIKAIEGQAKIDEEPEDDDDDDCDEDDIKGDQREGEVKIEGIVSKEKVGSSEAENSPGIRDGQPQTADSATPAGKEK